MDDGPKHAKPDNEMPARPARSIDIPPPLEQVAEPTPMSVQVSIWLWISSGVITAVTLVYAMFRLDERQAEFKIDILARDSDISAANLDGVVTILTVASISGLAVPAILQVILALVMGRGRNGARIFLAVVGVIGLPVVLIVGETLAGPGSIVSNYARLGTFMILLFSVVALVAMFLPSANAWFRGMRRR